MPREPVETVAYLDLQRFMGDWYVIACIPTFIDKHAYNAVESYELAGTHKVKTTFTFRNGGFDGKLETYHPTGFVRDTQSNAVWGMRFVWPFKADYRVLYVDGDYSVTVIGRRKRDYVWIMARTPHIPRDEYDKLVALVADRGYDTSRLRQVPQRWD